MLIPPSKRSCGCMLTHATPMKNSQQNRRRSSPIKRYEEAEEEEDEKKHDKKAGNEGAITTSRSNNKYPNVDLADFCSCSLLSLFFLLFLCSFYRVPSSSAFFVAS